MNKFEFDREIVFQAVKKNGGYLKYASEEFKNDREIVLEAVKGNGDALEYASEALKNDREIVMEAIKKEIIDEDNHSHPKFKDGGPLKFASKELRNDREVVLAAMKVNKDAIKYASESMINYFKINGGIEGVEYQIQLEKNIAQRDEISTDKPHLFKLVDNFLNRFRNNNEHNLQSNQKNCLK